MEDQQQKKYQLMTETPVSRLIPRMALPCVVSMLVTAFYNMADTFFVGMLKSNAATGAVGVVFSLMAVIQAIGFFFGHGSGNFISRELGRHKTMRRRREMAATGFFSALLAAGIVHHASWDCCFWSLWPICWAPRTPFCPTPKRTSA